MPFPPGTPPAGRPSTVKQPPRAQSNGSKEKYAAPVHRGARHHHSGPQRGRRRGEESPQAPTPAATGPSVPFSSPPLPTTPTRRLGMTTVLIVDDHALQRFGFRMLLEQHPDLTVVGEAAHGAEAVRKAAELRPDVVLMDVRMPGMDGIEATRRIVESGGHSHVLVLTTFDIDEHAYDALRAGARGFLLKDALPDALVAGIRSVAAGGVVIAPGLTRELTDVFSNRQPGRAPAKAAARRPAPARTRIPDPARARGTDRHCLRLEQPRDRRAVVVGRIHREDPRQPHPRQDRRPRPRPGRDLRLRHRTGQTGTTSTAARSEGRPQRS